MTELSRAEEAPASPIPASIESPFSDNSAAIAAAEPILTAVDTSIPPVDAISPAVVPAPDRPSVAPAPRRLADARRRLLSGAALLGRQAGTRMASAGTAGRSAVSAALSRSGSMRRPALAAAALVGAIALGYAGGRAVTGAAPESGLSVRLAETTSGLRQTHDETTRLAADLKALKSSMDALKSDRERSRGELSAKQTALSERSEKIAAETTGKLGRLADQLERLDKGRGDPARAAALAERLDRLEKHLQLAAAPAVAAPAPSPSVASAPTPPPKPQPQDVSQTGSLADPRAGKPDADPRRTLLEGFVVRDVMDGMALVESRRGRLFEVAAGSTLPGVGRVEAVERRGRQWVVVTPKGYIAAER